MILALGEPFETAIKNLFEIDRHRIDFFNCSAIINCKNCVESDYNCSWCNSESRCKHGEQICRMGRQLPAKMFQDMAKKSLSIYCPQIAAINKLETCKFYSVILL